MKYRFESVFPAAAASTLALAICSCGGGTKYSYQNVTVTISPTVQSVPVNAAQIFNATAINAPDYPVWLFQNVTAGSPNAGAISTVTTDAPTMTYTAPPTPPIYNPAQVTAGAVQGSVTVIAFVNNNPGNFLSDASATQTFVITAPSITVAISPATASVNLGGTQQFTAYAIGSVNNALTWQVNGVASGATATGTISTGGLYTAPTVAPMTGNTVTIAAVSQADSTKSASSIVTLTPP
jgi:hypothetical protein